MTSYQKTGPCAVRVSGAREGKEATPGDGTTEAVYSGADCPSLQ